MLVKQKMQAYHKTAEFALEEWPRGQEAVPLRAPATTAWETQKLRTTRGTAGASRHAQFYDLISQEENELWIPSTF